MAKNKENIEEFIKEIGHSPEIIAISETKIGPKSSSDYSIPGYIFLHEDSPTNAGGVAFYIKNNLNFNLRNDLIIRLTDCENLWIEIEQSRNRKLIVGVIYRHPTRDIPLSKTN